MKKLMVTLGVGVLLCTGIAFCQDNKQNLEELKKVIEIGELVNRSDFETAMKLCDEAVKQYPHNPDLYYWKASIYVNQKDNQNALKNIEKAIAIENNEAAFFVLRGSILSDMEKHDKAMEDFNNAIKIDPKNPFGYMIRAGEKITLGDYDGADADFKQASKMQKEAQQNHEEKPYLKSLPLKN